MQNFAFLCTIFVKIGYCLTRKYERVEQMASYGVDNFELMCPRDFYVNSFESDFRGGIVMRRRFKLGCLSLPDGVYERHCYKTESSSPWKNFQLRCDSTYYLAGFSGQGITAKDSSYQLYCCTSVGMVFNRCKQGPFTRPRGNFVKKLVMDNSVFIGLTSNYLAGKRDRVFKLNHCGYQILIARPEADFVDYQWPMNDVTLLPSRKLDRQSPVKVNRYLQPTSTAAFRTVTEDQDDFDIVIYQATTQGDIQQSYWTTPRPIATSRSTWPVILVTARSANAPGETTAFANFNIHCQIGFALRSILIRKVSNSDGQQDATFAIDCQPVPYQIDPVMFSSQEYTFEVLKDNSVQSACNFLHGQFLCGLKGIYDSRRRLMAHCCQVRYLRVEQFRTPIARMPTSNGTVLSAEGAMHHFIGNIDQILDGSFVAHIIYFMPAYSPMFQ